MDFFQLTMKRSFSIPMLKEPRGPFRFALLALMALAALWIVLTGCAQGDTKLTFQPPVIVQNIRKPCLNVWYSDSCAPCLKAKYEWDNDAGFRAAILAVYEVRFVNAEKFQAEANRRGITQLPAFEVPARGMKLMHYPGKTQLLAFLGIAQSEGQQQPQGAPQPTFGPDQAVPVNPPATPRHDKQLYDLVRDLHGRMDVLQSILNKNAEAGEKSVVDAASQIEKLREKIENDPTPAKIQAASETLDRIHAAINGIKSGAGVTAIATTATSSSSTAVLAPLLAFLPPPFNIVAEAGLLAYPVLHGAFAGIRALRRRRRTPKVSVPPIYGTAPIAPGNVVYTNDRATDARVVDLQRQLQEAQIYIAQLQGQAGAPAELKTIIVDKGVEWFRRAMEIVAKANPTDQSFRRWQKLVEQHFELVKSGDGA